MISLDEQWLYGIKMANEADAECRKRKDAEIERLRAALRGIYALSTPDQYYLSEKSALSIFEIARQALRDTISDKDYRNDHENQP